MSPGRTAAVLREVGAAGACRQLAEVRLPAGGEAPRVLVCGARVFVREHVAPHQLAYVEATVAQLPELAP